MRSPSSMRCLHGLLTTRSNSTLCKCRELRITFPRSPTNHKLVEIDGCKIKTVQVGKLLGFYIYSLSIRRFWEERGTDYIQKDLRWNS